MMKLLTIFTFFIFGICAWAQLAIDRHTIDGGGGTSTGGIYSVSGTVGQYDAGTNRLTGGSFSLAGGFWAVYAVQTAGAPFLSIEVSGPAEVTISWLPDDAGCCLLYTSDAADE